MDTVIGAPGGKVILTMDFIFCNFMAAFLLDSKDCAAVSHVFRCMKRRLKENNIRFGDIVPLALTDYAGERYTLPAGIENSLISDKSNLYGPSL